MINPFDPRTVFLARHVQHVVLIHFPIALFIAAVAFDLIALLDQAHHPDRRRLLQPAAGGDLHHPSPRHRTPRMATPARWPKTERHPAGAFAAGLRVNRDDLARLVDPFSRPP